MYMFSVYRFMHLFQHEISLTKETIKSKQIQPNEIKIKTRFGPTKTLIQTIRND